MLPGSLAAAARQAGAEPLWTGRPRTYAESTLRLVADRMDAQGAWCHVRSAVWRQVTHAVAKVDDEVIAYTDMENQLKALQARGFGRNRTRHLELTVSRGTEGELARLRAHEATLQEKLDGLEQQPFHQKTHERFLAMARRVYRARQKREGFEANAARKNTRVEGGGERLGKWLHLLVHNALSLTLAGSPDGAVRAMSTETVFELLLGRSALTCVEDGRLTM